MPIKIKLPSNGVSPAAAPRLVKSTVPSVLGDEEDLPVGMGDIREGDVHKAKPLARLHNALSNMEEKVTPVVKPKPKFNLPVLSPAVTQPPAAIVPFVAEPGTIPIPPLECSTCHIGAQCPEYNETLVCFYEKSFSSFDVRTTRGVLDTMGAIVAQNVKRLQLMYLSEQRVSGGMVDPNITRLSSEVMGQMERMVLLQKQSQTITVQASGPSAGGVLSRMFGKATNVPDEIELHPPTVGAERDEVTVTVQQESLRE